MTVSAGVAGNRWVRESYRAPLKRWRTTSLLLSGLMTLAVSLTPPVLMDTRGSLLSSSEDGVMIIFHWVTVSYKGCGKINANSGVSIDTTTMCRASVKDIVQVVDVISYYGSSPMAIHSGLWVDKEESSVVTFCQRYREN